MEFISSLTGKSPSTTGFGSEGALTKGPFNALWPVVDLNNALLSAILTGYAGFTTSAGYVGPQVRVDHDVSMLVPEVWCRMRVHERDPHFMISEGLLERIEDFQFDGRTVLASRLGYRITTLFADRFLGRLFETPDAVFTEEMLRPEKQSLELFASGVDAIVEAQRRVALNYFADGSVEAACPPLKGLLHIMARGNYEEMCLNDPRFRKLFNREGVLASGWYRERLRTSNRNAMPRSGVAMSRPWKIFNGPGHPRRPPAISTLKNEPARPKPNWLASLPLYISTNCGARSGRIRP